MLGMLILMPGISFARHSNTDSLVLNRIWDYSRNYSQSVNGIEQNVYLRYTFSTLRRNATLFLVPTMYTIAKGARHYIGESYGKITFRDVNDYDYNRQLISSTIPHQRIAMPTIFEYATPNLYNVCLYPNRLLSPFHRANRHYYRFWVTRSEGGLSVVRFRPRMKNTQLVNGLAIVDTNTGRLQSVQLNGEFDMLSFKVTALMDIHNLQTPLPERCTTEATFKFLGNRIKSFFTAVYNCPTTLPDSIHEHMDRQQMAKLRPIPLDDEEQAIYTDYDQQNMATVASPAETAEDSVQQEHYAKVKEMMWDIIGDNLVNGHNTNIGGISMSVSPLLNPLYMGYSRSKGISYKLNLGGRYAWNAHRYLTFEPQFGYNFRQKQFYYTIPLRMNYNPKRNGYAEILWANGNRISNGILADDFQHQMGDSINMPEFKDEYVQIVNNVVAFDWLEIMSGIIYHRRRATSRGLMQAAGLPDEYRSFAPILTLRFTPWHNGPTLTTNYERSFRNVFRSNLDYERWELDAVFKHQLTRLRLLNYRLGSGFYTHRSSNYFVDFANFRDNNLPTGWEDEWTGQFQPLNSRWYNESNYYFRGHVSYESPLLMLTWLPWAGRFIESERIYVSALGLQHTHPYCEVGYGFTNRYTTIGVFSSFLGTKFQDFGCKFTIELFRRW